MLDVRVSDGLDQESLVAFTDRLAATGRAGAAQRAARTRIVDDVRAGRVPAGLRRLALSLNTPLPPRPRRSSDDPETPASVVVEESLVVLSGASDDELVEALEALVGRGMRVVVTAADAGAPRALRGRLPSALAAHAVEKLPSLDPADLRRLRRLLATSTPERRIRGRQELPSAGALPAHEDIAGCCARAARTIDGADAEEARVLPSLLRDLDAERRAAVTQVGRCVGRTVGGLNASPHVGWLRPAVYQLVHNVHRAEYEQLQSLAAQQRDGLERFGGVPEVSEAGPVPVDAAVIVRDYLSYLTEGGRSRTYFRPPAQREAQPVLSLFRVGGVVPQSVDEVGAVAFHLDLAARHREIDRLCQVLAVPTPHGPNDLRELADALDVGAAAARSVGALRHDVLFLQQDSPVVVPDLTAAERVARAIVDYDEHGDPAEAADELDRQADELMATVPAPTMAPEHERLVAALRAHDADAYAEALDELEAARRDAADQRACNELLARLRTDAPALADAWAAGSGSRGTGYGLLCFAASDALLSGLPPADSADLVVVLGAGALSADALLLTAVAPRMVAVVGDEPRATSGTTLLEVLNQASARFLRGRTPTAPEATPDGDPVAIPAQNSARGED
ncbi:hypothetical protein [Pseudonocardia sp. KRD291]|uniref:hypothetical protein n=1 Tax=Pseudonocardia sp. KRD291 TaxID=2792007 RepID=UPI001C4A44F7|nr:hypothetical protein [Pseudonocardia sp. KRD291]MBW0104929.1 hypothetical protein [Pseudonocardia sp. KRD291]